MVGSESPVCRQGYPAGLCKFDRLVCTYRLACMQFSTGCYIFGRLCTTLSQHSAMLQRASLSFRPAVVQLSVGYGMPDRVYKSPKRPATHVTRASKHIGRLSKCQLAGVQNCRPVLTFSTGRSTLDRQCNSLPAEHNPIVRISHPESMRFTTGCASPGMASTSSCRFQDLMMSRFQEFDISRLSI